MVYSVTREILRTFLNEEVKIYDNLLKEQELNNVEGSLICSEVSSLIYEHMTTLKKALYLECNMTEGVMNS